MSRQLSVVSRQSQAALCVFLAFAALRAGPSSAAAASERKPEPTIAGRFLVLGDVPEPQPLPPGRDACCQAAAPTDESLLVGTEGGLANVIVSIEPRRGEAELPSTPPPSEPASLANRYCAFTPRVLITRVGQSLELLNADPTMHNVQVAFVRNPAVNVVVEPDGRRELRLARTERKPVMARCNVHTFMRSWIVVRDDPYAAISGWDGRFGLPAPPPGEWRLRFWHEGKPLVGLPVGDRTTDKRGEV
ncbi:MAG: hypothetical protein AAF266_12485, partial [Planctomycetota bacterium]